MSYLRRVMYIKTLGSSKLVKTLVSIPNCSHKQSTVVFENSGYTYAAKVDVETESQR